MSEGLSSLGIVGTDRRVRRVLELGQALIDAPRGIVLERYARDHGYSRSSAYRDLDVLRDIGFMITSDGGRHRVAASFRYFGHRGLDPDELLALFVARNVAGRIPGSRFDRALGALWAKLTADGRQPSLTPDRDGTLTVAAFQTIDYGPKREIIDTIDRGIADRVAIHITHRKTNGQVSQRIVEPGQLHAEASLDSLFLIGWCRRRRAVRCFAVHRIEEASLTGEKITPRPETRSRAWARDAFRMWLGHPDAAPVTVRIRFGRAVAGEIAERRWHPSQVMSQADDGELVLTLRVAQPDSLARWLMQYGADARVEEPVWLAEDLRARHAAAGRRAPARTVGAGAAATGPRRRQTGAPDSPSQIPGSTIVPPKKPVTPRGAYLP